MTNDATADKIARNNAAFRQANEAIAVAAAQHGLDDGRVVPFVCECSEASCTKVIRLTLHDYRRVRDNPRWFVHAKGHEATVAGAVRLVEEGDDFALVEKIGEAGELAVELAPDAQGE